MRDTEIENLMKLIDEIITLVRIGTTLAQT